MTVIGEIELKKQSIISCGLTPTAITFNQKGWNALIDEVHNIHQLNLSGHNLLNATFMGLSVNFNENQKEDFLIGVF